MPIDQANIQILIDDGGAIHLVWDNPLLDTVFTIRSPGGGRTFDAPVEVDKRQLEDDPGAAGPAKIRIAAKGDEVHLTWQAQHEESRCSQYHMLSGDNGRTWQSRHVALESTQGCPVNSRFVGSVGGFLLLLAETGLETFLQAWDGEQWGEPIPQLPLTRFASPDTYRGTDLSCLQLIVTGNMQLLVIGCGTGSGNDIWALKRPLDGIETWFVPEEIPVWSPPAALVSSDSELFSPALVASADGRLHVFWVGMKEEGLETAIHYVRWNGTQWSRPAPVFTGGADRLAAAVDPGGRHLFLVWKDTDTGSLLFGRVEVDDAVFPMRWTVPTEISSDQTAIGHPEIHVDETGILNVAYAVTVNEGRGIFLVQSEDQGTSWTEPVGVFDGAAAGWGVVDRPHLARTDDNALHLLWLHNSLSPGTDPLGLFYARSEDGGQSWSPPELVTEKASDQNHIVGIGDHTVLRVWQEVNQDNAILWYQQSLDSGHSFERASLIPGFGNLFGVTGLVGDVVNQLHLVQLMSGSARGLVLREWLWQGERWVSSDEQIWSPGADVSAAELAPAIGFNGQLTIVYPGISADTDIQGPQYDLFYSSRLFDLLRVEPVVLPTVTPTTASLPTEVAALQVTLTPPVAFSTTPDASGGLQLGPIDAGTATGGLIVGVVPAGLIVIGAVTLGTYLIRKRQR
jgi:hypothetical protein